MNEGKTVGNEKYTIPGHHGIVTQIHKRLSGCRRSEKGLVVPDPGDQMPSLKLREERVGKDEELREGTYDLLYLFICV